MGKKINVCAYFVFGIILLFYTTSKMNIYFFCHILMESFCNKMIKIFNCHITDDVILEYKEHTKAIKIELKYLVFYKFLLSFMTKEKASEIINNYTAYDRTSLSRQENQLAIEYYQKLNMQIVDICREY